MAANGWSVVTYEPLKAAGHETYKYMPSIGECGGFVYKPSITEVALTLPNIGDIVPCEKNYTMEHVQELYKTSIDLPGVPQGSLYGWSHDGNCWLYFTKGCSAPATHKAAYNA